MKFQVKLNSDYNLHVSHHQNTFHLHLCDSNMLLKCFSVLTKLFTIKSVTSHKHFSILKGKKERNQQIKCQKAHSELCRSLAVKKDP